MKHDGCVAWGLFMAAIAGAACACAANEPAATATTEAVAAANTPNRADTTAVGVLANDPVVNRFELNVLEDRRVAVEPGAEALGTAIGKCLDEAIARVEAFHEMRFLTPVRAYAFATDNGFREAAATTPEARGIAKLDRVFFSPKLAREWETIQGVVTHEFAHALLQQHIGVFRFNVRVPKWLAEGIAVINADGAGTEGVTEDDAIRAIARGDTFDIDRSRLRFHSENLRAVRDSRLMYKQAAMFVGFVRERDPQGFTRFLGQLRTQQFEAAFVDAFGKTPKELWSRFTAELRER